jgi:hypothetical protein
MEIGNRNQRVTSAAKDEPEEIADLIGTTQQILAIMKMELQNQV